MLGNAIALGFTKDGGAPAILQDGNTVAWFDADPFYITKDGSNFVSQWADKSGNSNHLLQAAGTKQPLWSADGVLGDGIDNIMQTGVFTFNQPEMIYWVARQITWTDTDRFGDGLNDVSGVITQFTGSPKINAYAGAFSGDNGNLTLNTFGIIRVLFNGASSKLIVNETTPVTGDFGAANMGGITLFGRGNDVANWGNVEFKEAIYRKIADTAPNEQAIHDYLKNKYSL